ncbi:family 78 glycoside hydrolase catalytic domain [Halegenticoccus tardaugens]|uniref:family 78 glycoside hydrolase catalytic domain n=1 Tax=Halegenticoccus tardaugens TaxID=2071624 RepID=UPI00100BDF35|nr:family 78 glycoside hydrolase catalytic domain [Halegenticoccus tardaugens]
MCAAFEEERLRRPTDLRVEYEETPENVDPTKSLRFSWRMETDERGVTQTAYRLVVGRDRDTVAEGHGTLWDSGRVESDRADNVDYDGPDLGADETYYWSVKVWIGGGETKWAEPARFATALPPESWRGDWITHQPGDGDTNGWRSRWRDPDENGEEWVQVDLGDSYEISEITLYGAEPVDVIRTPDDTAVTISWMDNPIAGFGFPTAYRIDVTDDPDFGDTTIVTDVTFDGGDGEEPEGVPTDDDIPVQTHDDLETSGRYVRITATDLFEVSPSTADVSHIRSEDRRVERTSAWQCFALAALSVESADGTERAFGASVDASSSVETDTWGRDQLVNGCTESQLGSTSPLLRTEFDLDAPVRSARMHVAAVGYGELYVNGDRIGDQRLDPAWTDYERRILYTSHDLTDTLNDGSNTVGLWLGRGWFAKSSSYWIGDGSPRARAMLTVEFEDGTTRRVTTNADWEATDSPILENDIYDGETYDSRTDEDGWCSSNFDASHWDSATVVDAPGGTLRPERIQPMRVVETFDVEGVHDHPDGKILDFGQNLTGWVRIEIDDPESGDEITVRHAETLTGDGALSTTDLRTAAATDTYVARGEGTEIYEPRFTYHGFRYAQVSGYPGDFDPAKATAKAVHTAMDRRGTFACSNEELNQLQHNAVWGLRNNTHSIPEDCPQRDERFGWTGDAHISTRALLFNYDAVRFDEKWARDHDDVASEMGYVPDVIPNKAAEDPADPTWSITRVVVPWYLYRHDGDERILREQYEGMREYVDYWYENTEDGILVDDYGKFGDWLAFENADGRRGLPHHFFNTAFLYQVVDIFAKIADVLDNNADAERYRNRAEQLFEAFNECYFNPEEGTYDPRTQSSYAVPLFLGLVPEEHVDRVAEKLAAKVRSDGGKLTTGFLGTRPLIHTLADHGYADLAYQVVSQPERPGWVYMVRNGATTMWERWNSDESVGSGMNSLNHSPFTHVSEFFYEVLAGIKLGDRPVTDHVTVAPSFVDGLDWVSASLETQAGTLSVDWERNGDSYVLAVTIPWNGRATVRLPHAADATVAESHVRLADSTPDGISSVERNGEELVVDVKSGTYEFSVE